MILLQKHQMFPKKTHGFFQCFQSYWGHIFRTIDVKIAKITIEDDMNAIESLLKQFEENF